MLTKFNEVVVLIRQARNEALKSVNKQLIDLYRSVGEHVSKRVEINEWGKGTVDELADYISKQEPGLRGFSARNIWRMMQFYDTYKDYPILSTLLTELPWSSNLHILSKTKTIEEKEFYIRLAIEDKLSVRQLERQIDSGYFERALMPNIKVSTVLTELYPQASDYFKDTYVLDFLNLPEAYSEFQLKKAIINNLKSFLMEIGRDFSFIGEEYQLQVGKQDFYIDLLFYHRELCCLVAFELKTDNFKPEYIGKLNFYLEALDRDVKKKHEKPSVGILLCKSKDTDVVEYALSRSLSPALVAEYNTKLIDKKLLQAKFNEICEISEEYTKN